MNNESHILLSASDISKQKGPQLCLEINFFKSFQWKRTIVDSVEVCFVQHEIRKSGFKYGKKFYKGDICKVFQLFFSSLAETQ